MSETMNVDDFLGSVELKTWWEADIQPDMSVRLVGASCAIHRRRGNSIKRVEFSESGLVMTIPAPPPEPLTLWQRIASWLQ